MCVRALGGLRGSWTPAAWGGGCESQQPPLEVVTHRLLIKLDYLSAHWVPMTPTCPENTVYRAWASDPSFSWRRQPKPQAGAQPLWRSSAQLTAGSSPDT